MKTNFPHEIFICKSLENFNLESLPSFVSSACSLVGHWRQDYSHTHVRHMNTSRDNVLTLNNGESKLPGLPLAKSHVEL